MKVLIACEFSGVVRDAFRRRGHDAWSCDILPSEPSPFQKYHKQCRLEELKYRHWDLAICHPPCTHLSVSGARWFKDKQVEQQEAIQFFMRCVEFGADRVCVENPVCIMSRLYRKPDQIIQPWMFGHGETKKTCLWLKNLPLLQPTNIVEGREQRIWKMPPSADRGKLRSITYTGIAEAMADQWGNLK